MTTTKLVRRLHGDEREVDRGPLDSFHLARRRILAGQPIEMKTLAAELGIDRATLFRWVGSREQLLVEVIWSTTEPTWQQAVRDAQGSGAARVADALDRLVRAVMGADFFAAYLRRERERALRLLTTKAGEFQQRVVAMIERLLIEEGRTAEMPLALPPHDLAYLLVRVNESFIYSDIIIGETPDASKAAEATSALLGISPLHYSVEQDQRGSSR